MTHPSAPGATGEHEGADTQAQALTPARAPVGTGAAPLFGQLVALALAALGVVGVEEAVVRVGIASGPSWISQVLDRFDGRTVPDWFLPAGVLVAVLGIAILPVVVRRRPRKTLDVSAATGVYLKTKDLARLVDARVDGLDGVTSTKVDASRRRLRVRVTTLASPEQNDSIVEEVEHRLASCLAALDQPPRLKVDIENEDVA